MTGGQYSISLPFGFRMLMHIRSGAELNEGLAYDGMSKVGISYRSLSHFLSFVPALALAFLSHHITSLSLSSRPLPCSDSHSHLSALLLYPPRFRDLWC